MTATTTGETSLQIPLDGDDVEQYFVQPGGFKQAMQTLADLFNSVTGHDHSGAGKGAKIGTAGIASGITITNPTFVGVVKGQTGWFDPVMLVRL